MKGGRAFGARLVAASIIGWVLLGPAAVDAQSLYYRSIPIGERAVGLGGAFTGLATDPSATYYNPAGVTTGGRFELLGSFSSLLLNRTKIVDAFSAPDVEENFVKKGTSTLPRFIGTVVRLGRAKHGQEHQFALGYSTVEVARENFGESFTQITEPSSTDLQVTNRYRDRWYGVSFGAQVSRKSAVGVSVFLSDQNVSYNESIGLAVGGEVNPDTGVRTGGQSITTTSTISARAYSFVLRLGWLHRINPRWRVGLMFQPPGIPLSHKGSFFRRSTAASDSGEDAFFPFEVDGVDSRLPIPFQLVGGFSYNINKKTLLAVDAGVTGHIRTGQLLKFDPPTSLTRAGVFYSPSNGRRAAPNFSVGVEHRFDKLVIAGGLFTNFSAAPNVPETSRQYTPDQVNLWGASFSIGLDTNGYRFTVGATGMYGAGDALGASIDQDGNLLEYERTSARRSIILLYVAGAIAVAAKTSKAVGEKYDDWKERRAKEEPLEAEQEGDGAADSETDSPETPDAASTPDSEGGPDASLGVLNVHF
ncbi:MAG: hypothetical protein WBG86_23080 [Polyangiales bacterium]